MQRNNTQQVQLELGGYTTNLCIPPFIFDPSDPWGKAYLEAIHKIDWTGMDVMEAGTGSGAGAIAMSRRGASSVFANDLTGRIVSVAEQNARESGLNGHTHQHMHFLPGDCIDVLRTGLSPGKMFDAITGCLPQVPGTRQELNSGEQTPAHLYDAETYTGFQEWGLGLIYAFASQARTRLNETGFLLVVLSGRVPEHIRRLVFSSLRFGEPSVLVRHVVRHHAGTPLKHLIGQKGCALLFSDPEGTQPLDPAHAERRRRRAQQDGTPESLRVFHTVEVWQIPRA